MNKLMLAATAALVMGGAAFAGDIVIPEDATPFKVSKEDVVRLPADGIAGTQVKVKVTGPAKDVVKLVAYRVKGATPIGSGNHVIDVTPTGKAGKVTVEVTVSPPNGKAVTTTYEFDVE